MLEATLDTATNPGQRWWCFGAEDIPGATWATAQSGYTAADMAAVIDARLAAYPVYVFMPTDVIVGYGANDCKNAGTIASYAASMAYIVDAVHAKWPLARIWLTTAYRGGYSMSIFDGFYADNEVIRAARSGYVFHGDDERAWFYPNLATYSTDEVHFNSAGRAAKVAAVKTAMGF